MSKCGFKMYLVVIVYVWNKLGVRINIMVLY